MEEKNNSNFRKFSSIGDLIQAIDKEIEKELNTIQKNNCQCNQKLKEEKVQVNKDTFKNIDDFETSNNQTPKDKLEERKELYLKLDNFLDSLEEQKQSLLNSLDRLKNSKQSKAAVSKLSNVLNGVLSHINSLIDEYSKKREQCRKEIIEDMGFDKVPRFAKEPAFNSDLTPNNKEFDSESKQLNELASAMNKISNAPVYVLLDGEVVESQIQSIDFDEKTVIVEILSTEDDLTIIKKIPFDQFGVTATQNKNHVKDLYNCFYY